MALTIAIFAAFVGFTLGLSFWLGRKAKTSSGYFAAHGQVGWFVNGIAFAGDYLSAASFLGICGMIAFYGYDGFLYSIGFLAGWVVALFVIAEPIKKLGKYTFADALNAKFNSPGITLAAAVSTLVVSIFYLIPQMVGAGSLMKALFGLPAYNWHGIDLNHAMGVTIVGVAVIVIVVTAGMVSTTWVQFIKGSLLVVFCLILTGMILNRGLVRGTDKSQSANFDYSDEKAYGSRIAAQFDPDGFQRSREKSQPLGPVDYLTELSNKKLVVGYTVKPGEPHNYSGQVLHEGNQIYYYGQRNIRDLLLPGGSPTFKGIRSPNLTDRLDFVSLMLALFCGTASLPHILIRYYTVKDAVAARKSTVVGIGAIGFFYILTLYIGLGAMVSGNLDPVDSNMAAPLLAKSFGGVMFACISAIAFTTVLGTVSGLILASAGAVAHDLVKTVLRHELEDHQQVKIAKIASVGVGIIAILLGILASSFNVTFLVGWAFNVAASANLPAIVMLLFWKGTTRQGIIASILVGLFSSLTWLMLSAPAYANIYAKWFEGVNPANALAPFSQPGLVTIPLAFVTLVVVSLITKTSTKRGFEVA
jgi:cation/acetate symporter